ncbi:MAG: hypothetical protein IJF71_02165 [Clostridia bacterium]|nr:hypothetical protein [Clostridia bacterium]
MSTDYRLKIKNIKTPTAPKAPTKKQELALSKELILQMADTVTAISIPRATLPIKAKIALFLHRKNKAAMQRQQTPMKNARNDSIPLINRP